MTPNYKRNEQEVNASRTDAESKAKIQINVKKMLEELMEAKDINGDYLFYVGSQWIAVYRVFVDVLDWTKEYRSFCNNIHYLGDFRVPCTENAVKRIDGVFDNPFDKWNDLKYKYNGKSSTFDRQYQVAEWLTEKIKKKGRKITAK